MNKVTGSGTLVTGVVLLIIGLSVFVVAGIQAFSQLQQDGIVLNNVLVEPNESISAVIRATSDGQVSTLSVLSQPSEVPVIAEVRDPQGETLSLFSVDKSPFVTSFRGEHAGDYVLIIKNSGEKAVTIQAASINIPTSAAIPSNDGTYIDTGSSIWRQESCSWEL